jgi:ATP-binding cassette, subfamily B, bacterial
MLQKRAESTTSSLQCHSESSLSKLAHGFYTGHKGSLWLYTVIFVSLAAKDVVYTHYFGKMISSLKDKDYKTLKFAIVVLLSIFAVFTGIGVMDAYLEAKLSTQFDSYIRNTLMMDLLKMQTVHYRELEQGEIMVRVNQLPSLLFYFFLFLRDNVIWRSTMSVFILGYFVWRYPMFSPPLLVVPIVLALAIRYTTSACIPQARARERSLVGIIRYMDDMLRNALSILNTNQQDRESTVIRKMHDVFEQITYDNMTCVVRSQVVISGSILVAVLILGYMMTQHVKQGKMDAGAIVAAILLLSMYFGGIQGIAGGMRFVVTRWGSIQEAFKVFEVCRWTLPPDDDDAAAASSSSAAATPTPTPTAATHQDQDQDLDGGCITVKRLTFGYANKAILKDVTLQFPNNKITLIVGPIGTGKSTLLALIMKYQQPSKGTLYLKGRPYTDIPITELRRRIGYVPQHPILFNRSIYENIIYGQDPATKQVASREHVRSMFQTLGLQSMLDMLSTSGGVDAPCGKNGSFLSGGQRQVVMLLRVLLQDPEVVLMDEPTASVDSVTKQQVMQLIQRMMKNRTVIMVTHDPELAKIANHIIDMGPTTPPTTTPSKRASPPKN